MCFRIKSTVILVFFIIMFMAVPVIARSQTTNGSSGIKLGVYLPDPGGL